jgi:hypothetical protein
MTAETLALTALSYRSGDRLYALMDINAALDGVPGAVNRFGSDPSLLKAAAAILGG